MFILGASLNSSLTLIVSLRHSHPKLNKCLIFQHRRKENGTRSRGPNRLAPCMHAIKHHAITATHMSVSVFSLTAGNIYLFNLIQKTSIDMHPVEAEIKTMI